MGFQIAHDHKQAAASRGRLAMSILFDVHMEEVSILVPKHKEFGNCYADSHNPPFLPIWMLKDVLIKSLLPLLDNLLQHQSLLSSVLHLYYILHSPNFRPET